MDYRGQFVNYWLSKNLLYLQFSRFWNRSDCEKSIDHTIHNNNNIVLHEVDVQFIWFLQSRTRANETREDHCLTNSWRSCSDNSHRNYIKKTYSARYLNSLGSFLTLCEKEKYIFPSKIFLFHSNSKSFDPIFLFFWLA